MLDEMASLFPKTSASFTSWIKRNKLIKDSVGQDGNNVGFSTSLMKNKDFCSFIDGYPREHFAKKFVNILKCFSKVDKNQRVRYFSFRISHRWEKLEKDFVFFNVSFIQSSQS